MKYNITYRYVVFLVEPESVRIQTLQILNLSLKGRLQIVTPAARMD